MATEATKTRACLKRVRQRWTRCWIWKTCDRFTKGIPDALLIDKGFSVFVEFKNLTADQEITDPALWRPLQRVTLEELDRVNDGGVIVVAFRGKVEELYWPYDLVRTHHRDLQHYLEEEWNH
jgi:hypothetical protein